MEGQVNYEDQQPASIEAEAAVLGLVLTLPELLPLATEVLETPDFYRQQNRVVFGACRSLRELGQPCDPLTVAEYLKVAGTLDKAGGRPYINELLIAATTRTMLPHYCGIIKDRSKRREVKRLTSKLQETVCEAETADEVIIDTYRRLAELAQEKSKTPTDVQWLVNEFMCNLERRFEGKEPPGLKTGFTDIDNIVNGLQAGELVYLAARPSMGKTMLAINLAHNFARNYKGQPGHRIAFFSLEMTKNQILERMMAREAQVCATSFRTGKLAESEWMAAAGAMERVAELEMSFFDVTDGVRTLAGIEGKCRRMVEDGRAPGAIFIDYIQLLNLDAKAREQRQLELSEISQGLKRLSVELQCPVFCLSQLSRAVESRQDKKPMLSDLRDSGSLEQDADIVMFIYRDEYYNPETTQKRGLAEVLIAKNRSGELGTVFLDYRPEFQTFYDSDKKPWDFAEPEQDQPKSKYRHKGKGKWPTTPKEDNE